MKPLQKRKWEKKDHTEGKKNDKAEDLEWKTREKISKKIKKAKR